MLAVLEDYVAAGLHVIPIEPYEKKPHPQLLPQREWRAHQQHAASMAQVQDWATRDPETNWAVCGGNGVICGDCDDKPAAQWILAHANEPLFEGACIVQSANGGAHVWFAYEYAPGDKPLATGTWRLVPGRKMGEIRATGSYTLVPPSRLQGAREYLCIAGNMRELPVIDDPTQFLARITTAYLTDEPDRTPPPDRTSKAIADVNPSQRDSILSRVRADKFKKKILDTLFLDGHQTPGILNWQHVDSNSEIDFAVCCEFYRKGWAFLDVEQVFAVTRVGEACYRNTDRSNHGQGYLWATWEQACKAVDADAFSRSLPQGANFQVVRAAILDLGEEKHYALDMVDPDGEHHLIDGITSEQLSNLKMFAKVCRAKIRFGPKFNPNQTGEDFWEAVDKIVSQIEYPPEDSTPAGRLAAEIRDMVLRMPDRGMPDTFAETRGMGWRVGNDCWVRSLQLMHRLDMQHVAYDAARLSKALRILSTDTAQVWQDWPDHERERVIHLRLRPRAS